MKALQELMANQGWMIHDLVDGDQIDNKEERKLLKLTEQAAQDLARITAENIALRDIARAVTLLDDGTGMRTFPSKSLIEKARAALKQPS